MKRLFFLVTTLGVSLVSCNNTGNVPPAIDLHVSFSHVVNGSPVQLDALVYQNNLGQEFSLKTIKYFISRVKLYRAGNTVIALPDIHYVDIRLPETLNYTFAGKIPAGDYTGLSFVYGLIPEENISGRFTQPPESLMEWPEPMGGGYHYAKIEGVYRTPSEEGFFNFHSGMLDGVAYEIHVDRTNQPFTLSEDKAVVNLQMEIQNWFQNPNDWDFAYYGPAIMGNHEAQKAIQENGGDVFSFAITGSLP